MRSAHDSPRPPQPAHRPLRSSAIGTIAPMDACRGVSAISVSSGTARSSDETNVSRTRSTAGAIDGKSIAISSAKQVRIRLSVAGPSAGAGVASSRNGRWKSVTCVCRSSCGEPHCGYFGTGTAPCQGWTRGDTMQHAQGVARDGRRETTTADVSRLRRVAPPHSRGADRPARKSPATMRIRWSSSARA